jgi:sulfite reductase alpha subunit-like flavoprotein
LRFALKSNPKNQKKGVAKHPFPTPITFREALTNFIDLKGAVRKKVLKDFSIYCTDEEEKQK